MGTASVDTVRYLMHRRAGDKESPLAWEFAPVDTWEQAPEPGQVAKGVIEGFTKRILPGRWAWLLSTAAHWGYGSSAGAAYGIVAGSLGRPNALYGLPFGAAVFAGDYIALPARRAVQADLGVRRQDPGHRSERAPRVRHGHRDRVLAAGHRRVGARLRSF